MTTHKITAFQVHPTRYTDAYGGGREAHGLARGCTWKGAGLMGWVHVHDAALLALLEHAEGEEQLNAREDRDERGHREEAEDGGHGSGRLLELRSLSLRKRALQALGLAGADLDNPAEPELLDGGTGDARGIRNRENLLAGQLLELGAKRLDGRDLGVHGWIIIPKRIGKQ